MYKENTTLNNANDAKCTHNYNIDILKVVAAFFVVYSHFNSFSTVGIEYWFTAEGFVGYVLLSISAFGVPVFLLINGYLIINKESSLEKMVGKAFHVIIITFLWGMLYNCIFSVCFEEHKTLIDIARIAYQGGDIKESILAYVIGIFGR